MTQPEEKPPDLNKDLAEDWPKGTESEELLAFAQDLNNAMPPLEAERMDRVKERLTTELDSQASSAPSEPEVKPIHRMLILGGGLAAGLLLVLGLRMSGMSLNPWDNGEETHIPPIHPTRITKTYDVQFVALNAPKAPKEPLLSITKYKELFKP